MHPLTFQAHRDEIQRKFDALRNSCTVSTHKLKMKGKSLSGVIVLVTDFSIQSCSLKSMMLCFVLIFQGATGFKMLRTIL